MQYSNTEESMMANSNPNVAFLMMETDSSKDEWGWAPMYWNSEIGNVWAVREDGRDLAVNDVAMMCHFARRKLQPELRNDLSVIEAFEV
ncbi:Mitochondrial chaperone BCS1 [Penicillium argentinense]|uniref:Mitochondrial chaperone BCS1 n=1 Tax=Penicillium argentinense TaxID=1131581 RepID=A0A9W9KKG6_9EURO|nr:Mitochondrial chaperone BCS1 [Penicillium argentinense]KAJ5109635.1 Mitochondrial chaperone BCS1 [Penicillium argentinense]